MWRFVMKIEARVSISRTQNSHDDSPPIRITLTDVKSGVEFVRLNMTAEDFAKCVTGQGYMPASGDFHGELVGMQREVKNEEVPGEYDADPAQACAPFEADGWKAYLGDFGNPHRRSKGGYRVSFTRYVQPAK
jgi:hypothetical protein